MKCPQCNKQLKQRKDILFCNECNISFCPKCNKELQDNNEVLLCNNCDIRYCKTCGKEVAYNKILCADCKSIVNNHLLTFYGEFSLEYWITLLLSKQITLPTFQRKYEWSPYMINELIETLEKNYYVPQVLIANGIKFENSERTNLILDGQQRLTSIALCYFNVFPNINKDNCKNKRDWNKDFISGWNWDSFIDIFDKLKLMEYYKKERYDEIQKKLIETGKFININDKLVYKFLSKNEDVREKFLNIIKSKDFFKSRMLGYAYLKYEVPDENKEIESYAHMFRIINTSGKELSDLESRRPLYSIKQKPIKFIDYFEPTFVKDIYEDGDPIDFVQLLAYTAEFCQNLKDNQPNPESVAEGYSTPKRREIYFEKYVLSCMMNNEDSVFGKFTKNVNEPLEKINNLHKYIKEIYSKYIEIKKNSKNATDNNNMQCKDSSRVEFGNKVESQYLLLGLIYHVIYEAKNINCDNLVDLIKSLRNEIEEDTKPVEKGGLDYKKYNQLEQVRKRLKKSIEIYREFINAN